jgi:small subunit ribosomal protein S9
MAEKSLVSSSSKPPRTPSLKEYYYGCGKRKTAVARVRLYKDGKGIITVNDQPAEKYFVLTTQQGTIVSPLKITGLNKKFDISIKVNGGGINAQADASRHGISRALLEYDDSLRQALKKAGFLTRDARIKERKKPGLKRARRAPQFSKR